MVEGHDKRAALLGSHGLPPLFLGTADGVMDVTYSMALVHQVLLTQQTESCLPNTVYGSLLASFTPLAVSQL